jgi:Pentapeptide repeats (8 copies)
MKRQIALLRVGIAVVLALGIAAICIYAFPSWIVRRGINHSAFRELKPDQRLKAENDVRAALLQALAGAAVLTGGLAAWGQFKVAREGKITDRYTSAVQQLGDAKPAVRIGGIYALERIAKDSDVDRRTIIEVLSAFVRQRARRPPTGGENDEEKKVRADVQAALTVLGRLDQSGMKIDLSDTDLHRVELPSSNFDGAEFTFAVLREAHLPEARLRDARFCWADLSGANLRKAVLQSAVLSLNARDDGADLTGADLRGADLRGAKLHGAVLESAKADATTKWPEDFGYQEARDAGVLFDEETATIADG